jgi:hypothetical protein
MNFDNLNMRIRTVVEIIVVPIIGYGVVLLSDMNKNIQELNTQMALIIAEREVTKDVLKDHELRLRVLERGK